MIQSPELSEEGIIGFIKKGVQKLIDKHNEYGEVFAKQDAVNAFLMFLNVKKGCELEWKGFLKYMKQSSSGYGKEHIDEWIAKRSKIIKAMINAVDNNKDYKEYARLMKLCVEESDDREKSDKLYDQAMVHGEAFIAWIDDFKKGFLPQILDITPKVKEEFFSRKNFKEIQNKKEGKENMELSIEAKKSKKPTAKDVYETAEEVKKLKKKIKDEKKKKNPDKEKIKKWEELKKKKASEKNRLKNARKDKKSSEVLNWDNFAFREMVFDNKETFFKSISKPFNHLSIGKENVNLYGYHSSSPIKYIHQGEFNKNHHKAASKELESIIPVINKICDKAVDGCFDTEAMSILNTIGMTNKFDSKSIKKLIRSNISINKNYKKELVTLQKPKLQFRTWFLKMKSFESIQRDIFSNTERGAVSFREIGSEAFRSIPNVSIAIIDNIKNALNKKLKYYKCIESRDDDKNLVLTLESKFGTYHYKGFESDVSYSMNCYIPRDYNNFGWEDCCDEFMKTAIESGNNVMELDLSRPYMALSAIFGSSLRNQKERRVLSSSQATNGLFYLTFIPEKKEMTKTFHCIYSAKLSFDFIERIRKNIENLDQRDTMLLSYEFGRVLAYYTFLLTINRTQAPVLNELLEEVKVVLITLAELVKKAEIDGKFDDILGGDNDTKEKEIDSLDNGEWKMGSSLSPSFVKMIDELDNYTDGTYNDTPFPFIFSLAYIALQYILIGIVPTTISQKNDITMNEFLMACKGEEIKNYVNRLVVDESESYSTRALYGMIYTYYKLRNYFSVVGLGINPVVNGTEFANNDIFFSSLYKIGELLEADYLTKDDSNNKPYLVEILENGLFNGNIRLLDLLNVYQVFNPSDDLIRVDDINVPFVLTAPLNQLSYSSSGFNTNPITKLVANAIANGTADSFDPKSVELYVLEYLSNVDCHIVSPYRIYKIAMLAAMSRQMYYELEKSHTDDKDLKDTLGSIIILCDSLILKLYDEWFNTRSTIYRFESRMTDYPIAAFRNNKDKYLKWEIDLILTYYGNFIIDVNKSVDAAWIINSPWFVDINNVNNTPNLLYYGDTFANKENYNDFTNYIEFKLPILISATNPDVFVQKSIMMECLDRLNNQPEMYDKIKSLVTDALPLPQTSSKTEVIDAMYKDTAYPSAIFAKIISNVSTILERTDLTSEAKFYLTYCLIYSSIIRNHINNVLIRPNSNIATVDNKDDLVEMATQTSNSIESYINWIMKKAGIEENSKPKHGWF